MKKNSCLRILFKIRCSGWAALNRKRPIPTLQKFIHLKQSLKNNLLYQEGLRMVKFREKVERLGNGDG